MNWLKPIIVAVALLGLGGCVEIAGRAMVEGAYLADSASDYVREVHDLRRWIREQCRDLLKAEIKTAGDDPDKVRQLLIDSYPPLVTVGVVRDVKAGSVLSVPVGCGVDQIGLKE